MARLSANGQSSGRSILVVDDSPEYLEATKRILLREGHTVHTAESGPEALAFLRESMVDLILLDFYMPGMTGEEMVRELRTFNKYVQIVLQTGYASENPPRDLLRRLDIQGYFEKSDGTEKLLMWVEIGLKSAYNIQLLLKSRQGLRFILEATPELHRLQPLEDLLQGILFQISGLLGCTNSFLAVLNPEKMTAPELHGFLAIADVEMHLQVHAGVGRFNRENKLDTILDPEKIRAINEIFRAGKPAYLDHETIFPLRIGENTLGLIYLDISEPNAVDVDLLTVFANQATVAIQNSQLYSMATQDPLTEVFVRKFYDTWIIKELRGSYRAKTPISLLMFDLDNMKSVNDTLGHPAGDLALSRVGKILKKATRATDFVARFGGDEFVVILPATDAKGSEVVAAKILGMLHEENLSFEGTIIPLRASIGTACLFPRDSADGAGAGAGDKGGNAQSAAYFSQVAAAMLKAADSSLYQAKKAGRDCAGPSIPLAWT